MIFTHKSNIIFVIHKGFITGLTVGSIWLVIFGSYAVAFYYGWHLSVNGDYDVGKVLLVFFK